MSEEPTPLDRAVVALSPASGFEPVPFASIGGRTLPHVPIAEVANRRGLVTGGFR